MVAGVCYGVVGNNLPSASDVVQLYRSKGITGMRIYFPDSNALKALSGSGINLIIDVGNDQLGNLAASASNAAAWVKDNIQAYQGLTIKYITVGNEVSGSDAQLILPAMKNVNAALSNVGLGGIKVSTAVQSGVTAVQSDVSGKDYQNLFDALMDTMYSALESAGAGSVGIVVSESGWPSAGDPVATAGNAQTYNQNLIDHVGKGTPKRTGTIETYIFAMFNENNKTGLETERHFGLFNPDKSPAYPIRF